MSKPIAFFRRNAYILILIVLSLFMRLYRLTDFFPFDLDVEYLAQLAQTIIHDFHIIWIGVSAGATNYYLGPGYVYLTALILLLSPLALGVVSSLMGVVTTLTVYFAARLYGNTIAKGAALLYAASAGAALLDRRWWPPPVGLVGLIFLLVFEKSRKNTRWFILGALCMALSLHLHLSLIVFFPCMAWALWRERRKLTWRLIALMGIVYIIGTIPLTVYDIVHNFDNARAPFVALSGGKGSVYHAFETTGILGALWYPHSVAFVVTIAGVAAAIKRKMTFPVIVTVAYGLLFLVYPGALQLYYGAVIMPFLALLGGALLSYIQPKLRILFISLFIAYNVFRIITLPAHPDSYSVKMKVVSTAARQAKGVPTTLIIEPNYRASGGWHYLLFRSGVPVVSGSSDEFYRWIYSQYLDVDAPSKYSITIKNGKLVE